MTEELYKASTRFGQIKLHFGTGIQTFDLGLQFPGNGVRLFDAELGRAGIRESHDLEVKMSWGRWRWEVG